MKKIFAYTCLTLLLAILFSLAIQATQYTVMYRETDGLNVARTPRVIHICPSGCRYTTLNAACAAQTSTSSAPIIYYVHAGVYSSATQQTCSGEDYATIMGDGPSTRIINTETGLNTDPNGEGAGDYGTIGMGTSTNWTIKDMYISGHRTIYMDGNGTGSTETGGGKIYILNNVLETAGVVANEDCFFARDPVANTEYHIFGNTCTHTTDGFTNISGDTKWFVGNNIFKQTTDTTIGQTGGAYAMQAIPRLFIDNGSSFVLGRSLTGALPAINYAYWFNGGAAAGGEGAECTTTCEAFIHSPTVKLDNTDGTGNSVSITAIQVSSTGTNLDTLEIYNPDIQVTTTDSTTGSTYGLYIANDSTAASIHGGRIRTSGGNSNNAINVTTSPPTHPVQIFDLDHTIDSADKTASGDVQRVYASDWIGAGPVQTVYGINFGYLNVLSTLDSEIGLFMDNRDSTNNELSPRAKFCNGGASENCYSLYTGADDHFYLKDDTGNRTLVDIATAGSGTAAINQTHIYFYYPGIGGAITLGDGTNTDVSDFIEFDSTNDLVATWVSSTKKWDLAGAEALQIDAVAAPSIVASGDIGIDTSANQVVYFANSAVRVLDPVRTESIFLASPSSSTDPVWFKVAGQITVSAINCIVDPEGSGESVVITVRECDGNGDNCAGLDGATTITCANTNTADDGSLSNAALDNGDWVDIDTDTVTGTVTRLAVTITYTVDRQ